MVSWISLFSLIIWVDENLKCLPFNFKSGSAQKIKFLSKIKKNKLTDSKWSYWFFFFYFSRLIQKKSKPTTNGYSINTDHRMRMSTMWNNYRYISDRTEFYKETLQWGVWTIDRTVKCFRSIVVEVYQCIDFVMDRKLAWTSASRNSTPSLTFFQGHNVTTLHHDTVARIYVSVAIVFIKKKNQEALMVK